MPVYSVVIYRGTLVSNAATTIYTVPADRTLVVRDLFVRANAAVSDFTLYDVGAGIRLAGFDGALASGAQRQWQGRQVLEAGAQLGAVSAGGGAQVSVSGYLLTI